MAATMLTGTHPVHPPTSLDTPYHFLMAEGTAKGKWLIRDNEFIGFSGSKKQTILTPQAGPDNMNVNIF